MSKDAILAVAIHEIETLQNGKPKAIVSGSVFSIDPENHANLKKLGALSEPTEAEVALYEKTQPKAKSEAAPKQDGNKGKGKGKGKAAADEGEGAGEGTGKDAGEGAGGNADIV